MANPSEPQSNLPGRTALAGIAAARSDNFAAGHGLVFAELPHLGKLNLRGGAALDAPVEAVSGCAFPPAANRFTSAGARHVLWLGPDEFLLLCEAGKEQALEDQLMRLIDTAASTAAVTDVTDSLCVFDLQGPAVRKVLAKGCSLDLHHDAFIPGCCAQTMLALAGVTMMATAADRFLVICRTSFAPYLQHWLYDAGLEYGVAFTN